eukprot:TRINITY_DN27719_c0_g1_i1.p1 TRINITY_DN27719_c0_g1~~TRINITY_DN27719_c0_g1_i1.p1  ORF type:complete len:444 (+),score=40.33 TRINITY_DN27719_c0_g1_i1:1-1332(+)
MQVKIFYPSFVKVYVEYVSYALNITTLVRYVVICLFRPQLVSRRIWGRQAFQAQSLVCAQFQILGKCFSKLKKTKGEMKITANVKCAKQRLKLRRKVFSYLLFGAFCLAALFFLYDYQFGGDSDAKVWNNRSLLSAATCRESKTWEKKGGVTIYFIGVLYLFLGIAIVCDDFFVASLESISHVLHLSEDVAGATFMAAGSSAPELFSSMMALTNPNAESEIGVGTIVGSAVFNILVIIGITAVFAGRTLHLDWKPLIRDAVFYLAAVASILLIFMDKKVYWWEGLICVLCYAGYVLFMAYNHTIMSWIDSKMGSRQNMHEMQTSKSDISLETMTDGIKSIPSGQQDLAQLERLEVQPEGQGGTGNNQDEEVEEEDSNPFALPEKAIDIPMWLLSLPWYVAYTYTIPPCNKERWANWYPVTFLVSVLWIGGISWFMVVWALRVG